MQTYLKMLAVLRLVTEKKLVAEVLMVLKRKKIPEGRTLSAKTNKRRKFFVKEQSTNSRHKLLQH